MCEACQHNGPDSIAGVLISEYLEKYRAGKVFRLKLCPELESLLLVALCARSVTLSDKLKGRNELMTNLFKDMGLEEKYGQGFERVLRGRLVEESLRLLRQAEKWDAFITIDTGKKTSRLVWNANIVMANISNQRDAQCWIAANRTREREDGRMRKSKEKENQASIAERALAQQLAELDISSSNKSERKSHRDRVSEELEPKTPLFGREVTSSPAPKASPQERVVIDSTQDRVSQPFGSTTQKQYGVELPRTDSRPSFDSNDMRQQKQYADMQPRARSVPEELSGGHDPKPDEEEEIEELEINEDFFEQMHPQIMAQISARLSQE